MIIIKHPPALRKLIAGQRLAGKVVGFVPTMGALHAGHLDLVRISQSQCDITVCSIFVNPTQFNDPGDFKKYPHTLENDIRLLERAGAGVLFVPDTDDVYPEGTGGLKTYPLGYLETILEGKFRPGHFQGVCQVMDRLLALVAPDRLFMGQKDYQQCMVVETLLRHLGLPVALIKCATMREPDGLAMSSRNLRLSPEQRSSAPAIYRSLKHAAEKIGSEDFSVIGANACDELRRLGFRPDYFEIADAATLLPAQAHHPAKGLVILVAAFQGEVRLIDNLLVS